MCSLQGSLCLRLVCCLCLVAAVYLSTGHWADPPNVSMSGQGRASTLQPLHSARTHKPDSNPQPGIAIALSEISSAASSQAHHPNCHMTSRVNSTACVQGLWRIREWTAGNLSSVTEFLCVLDGLGSADVGDIAVMCEGDLVVSVTANSAPSGQGWHQLQ